MQTTDTLKIKSLLQSGYNLFVYNWMNRGKGLLLHLGWLFIVYILPLFIVAGFMEFDRTGTLIKHREIEGMLYRFQGIGDTLYIPFFAMFLAYYLIYYTFVKDFRSQIVNFEFMRSGSRVALFLSKLITTNILLGIGIFFIFNLCYLFLFFRAPMSMNEKIFFFFKNDFFKFYQMIICQQWMAVVAYQLLFLPSIFFKKKGLAFVYIMFSLERALSDVPVLQIFFVRFHLMKIFTIFSSRKNHLYFDYSPFLKAFSGWGYIITLTIVSLSLSAWLYSRQQVQDLKQH